MNATPNQINDALNALTEQEWTMLRRGARKWLGGTSFTEPEELFNETVARLLEGVRHWPLHIKFGPFLQLAMRSIAGHDRESQSKQAKSRGDFDEFEQGGSDGDCGWEGGIMMGSRLRLPSVESLQSQHQRGWLAIEAARGARAALAGDCEAQAVIDSMNECMEADEAMAAYGIGPARFEAAHKRAVRALRRRAMPLFGPDESAAAARAHQGDRHA